MNQSDASRSENSGPTTVCYITAVGAAFIATFFDHVRNSELSAMQKTAVTIRDILKLSDGSTSSQLVIAILIFCATAAILVCAYRPKETKESFLLGLTVLAVAGFSVPPVQQTGKEAKSSVVSRKVSLFDILPLSTARADEPRVLTDERMIWIFLDGPGQRQIPETRVVVYSGATGSLLINSLVFTKFYLIVPSGVNRVELSRLGYRNVSFKIDPSRDISVYRVPMKETRFESLANFLGPESISIQEDPVLSEFLEKSVTECRNKQVETATNYAKQAGVKAEKLERDARRLLCL